MSSPIIGFNSYVDIAICMVIQLSDCIKLQKSVLERRKDKETREFTLDPTDPAFEASPKSLLRLEWSNRIEEWQRLYPDKGPRAENWSSLKEFEFGAFFLQHPISAMSLWKVMQTFYALDHLVCYTSKESRERVAEWESMPPFEYLDANRVERRWRSSLQNLKKEIENENSEDAPLPRIYFVVKKLEDSCEELGHSFNENLKGVKLVEPMLKQIKVAAGRRFSMIDTYLKLDENHSGKKNATKAVKIITGSINSTPDQKPEKPEISSPQEPRRFKPLTRTKTIDVFKKHLLIAWASTKKGEATLSAIFIIVILLFCLYQIKGYLVVKPEP